MTNELWAITTFFNPAKFSSLLHNYHVFADKLKEQRVNLLTVECAFNGDDFQIPEGKNVIHLRSNSIMWQKERLINYAVSKLPHDCKYFAWLDCDIIFTQDDWAKQAVEKLKKNDVIQLFKKVVYLPKGHLQYNGKDRLLLVQGVVWQKMIHRNWLNRRRAHQLPFSAPGFAWAARKDFFFCPELKGLYDKNIIGSGDTFLVDCYFDSWDIHGFAKKFTPAMKEHMMDWCAKLKAKKPRLDYLPIDIWHLWHGSLKNRAYMDRHDIILEFDYDPINDIVLYGNVYEWANRHKKGMHDAIKGYFHSRKEDEV